MCDATHAGGMASAVGECSVVRPNTAAEALLNAPQSDTQAIVAFGSGGESGVFSPVDSGPAPLSPDAAFECVDNIKTSRSEKQDTSSVIVAGRPAHGVQCPICLGVPEAPFATRCGHSFCHVCIATYMGDASAAMACAKPPVDTGKDASVSKPCPVCAAPVSEIFPNHALSAALSAIGKRPAQQYSEGPLSYKSTLGDEQTLLAFLKSMLTSQQAAYAAAGACVSQLERDIVRVERRLGMSSDRCNERLALADAPPSAELELDVCDPPNAPFLRELDSLDYEERLAAKRFSGAVAEPQSKVLETHAEDLAARYFGVASIGASDAACEAADALDALRGLVARVSRCSQLRVLASVRHADLSGAANIVSSMEFARCGRVFATAGVSRRIRMFDLNDVVSGLGRAGTGSSQAAVQIARGEIATRSKLACISWNTYMGSLLAAADYDGAVAVYDASRAGAGPATGACAPLLSYGEHEKRCWSVDWCAGDPTRLASSSDDGSVRVWSTRTRRSVLAIHGRANVCSVRFHPVHSHVLAFGSADHGVHVYDLRRASSPLAVLRGHAKAVSYVRFAAGGASLISASTDGTLRLWDWAYAADGAAAPQGPDRALPSGARRVLRGHTNDRNFVGMSVLPTPSGDLVACGSESNAAFVYDSALSRPLAAHRFSAGTCPLTSAVFETALPSSAGDTANAHFVSSVAWAPSPDVLADGVPGAPVLLAANSLGTLRVLQLS